MRPKSVIFMSLEKIFIVTQVVIGLLAVAAILLQNRSASLGESFGGSGVFYGTRRGPERVLYFITIGLVTAFVLLSFIVLFL